jgi:hypothetical protein
VVEAGEFLPPEAGEPPIPSGTGDVALINGMLYDNPLLDADYNNDLLRFRSMSELIRPMVPPG